MECDDDYCFFPLVDVSFFFFFSLYVRISVVPMKTFRRKKECDEERTICLKASKSVQARGHNKEVFPLFLVHPQ